MKRGILTVGMVLVLVTAMCFTAYADDIPDSENPYRQIIMNMTEEEIVEIQQVLCLEAGTDTWEGRVATAQVIFNRVLDPRFPNTVHQVLSQKHQYSTYKRRHKADYGERECDAIEHLCNGGEWYIGLDRIYQDCAPIGKNPIKVGKQYFGK